MRVDALVEVVYERNLDIDQVDKDAGILTLDPLSITMKQMDRYCEFPAIDTEGRPASNFVDADRNRKEDGKDGLGCTVTMSFLVKRLDDESSNLSVRADWYATNGTDTVQCASRGIFEAEMLNAVKDHLLAPR